MERPGRGQEWDEVIDRIRMTLSTDAGDGPCSSDRSSQDFNSHFGEPMSGCSNSYKAIRVH